MDVMEQTLFTATEGLMTPNSPFLRQRSRSSSTSSASNSLQSSHNVSPVNVNTTSKPISSFVRKLINMVNDENFQHLISWSYSGSSFIVCNVQEFSRSVLPVHFKHNNFSSFVRQLNMYGFYKVNKSPRGHRSLSDNQIWEFSHQNFLRDCPDLLPSIRRKTVDPDPSLRREDLYARLNSLQTANSELNQRMMQLSGNFAEMLKVVEDMRKTQAMQQKIIRQLALLLAKQKLQNQQNQQNQQQLQQLQQPVQQQENNMEGSLEKEMGFFKKSFYSPYLMNDLYLPLSNASGEVTGGDTDILLNEQLSNTGMDQGEEKRLLAAGVPLPPSPCGSVVEEEWEDHRMGMQLSA
ncbi:uncharacterized protein VTP21DRAFT_4017 [Calcarisporiella thermophila]|uniref:uncharacterized protein n=1 Tax=Calcarisporiella thermophila TaxID=911321 RepID=UPI0037449E5A